MKFFIFFFIFLLSLSLSHCLHVSLTRKEAKSKKGVDRYTPAKAVFLRAASSSGGQYLDQSWTQQNFIFQNREFLTSAIDSLTASKRSATTFLNLGSLRSSSKGISTGISLYFLSEIKRLKTNGPIIKAGDRIDPELQRLANSADQNTYLKDALELLNSVYGKNLNTAAGSKNLRFSQETTISTADSARKSKEIFEWLNSKYTTINSFFLLEFKAHTSAFVGILPNLSFFFDPNFGIVKFTSIAQIDKFFLEIFNEKVFQDIYMDNGNQKGVTLKAFN